MFEDSIAAIPSIWSSMTKWLSPTVLFVLLNVMIGIIAFTSTLANKTKHNINRQEHSQTHQNQYHNNHQQKQHHQQPNILARSPSLLDRVKSINFYSYISQEPTTNFNLEHTQKLENSSYNIFEQPHQENEPNTSNNPFTTPSHQNHQENNLQPQVNDQYNFNHTQEEESQNINVFPANINEFGLHHNNEEHFEEQEEEDGDGLQSLDEVYSKLTCSHFMRTNSDTKPSSGEAPPKLPTKMRKYASLKSPFGHFEAEDIVENKQKMDHGVDAKADDFISMFKEHLKLQRRDSIIKYKEMITRGSGK